MPGTLILCATPIGNLDDVSKRLTDVLETADVIFAEDTRRTARLLQAIGVTTPMRSYFVGNERARNDELSQRLGDGATVALVSDAGMPVVSDPGASAVEVAIDAGARVTAVPGPSAPVMALALSGYPGDRFVFEGFLPRKGSEREARLRAIAEDLRPTVLFCATRRVGSDLQDLASHTGPEREVVVTRELTKLHEEVWRGPLDAAVGAFGGATGARGEFTVVVSPAEPAPVDLDAALKRAFEEVAGGLSMSRAARMVAAETGVSKNDLYEAMLASDEGPTEG